MNEILNQMQSYINGADHYLAELSKGYCSPEKANTLLDVIMQQIELCCIEMRRLCEKARPKIPETKRKSTLNYKQIYGSVTILDNSTTDIKLNALLPHCKVLGGTQYVSDSITRLLNEFSEKGGKTSNYNKAFVAIVEHCEEDYSGVFDQDNKGYKGVINALKGRLFADDDQFELSLGLFTVRDSEECCHIYVMAAEDAGYFLNMLNSGDLFI